MLMKIDKDLLNFIKTVKNKNDSFYNFIEILFPLIKENYEFFVRIDRDLLNLINFVKGKDDNFKTFVSYLLPLIEDNFELLIEIDKNFSKNKIPILKYLNKFFLRKMNEEKRLEKL